MKRTFSFTSSNKVPERKADDIKHEIKKYVGRERRKSVPEGYDYWDFDCKFGDTEESAVTVPLKDINKHITQVLESGKDTFYVEVMAKPCKKPDRPHK